MYQLAPGAKAEVSYLCLFTPRFLGIFPLQALLVLLFRPLVGREEDELGGREEEVEHKLGEEVRVAKMMAR